MYVNWQICCSYSRANKELQIVNCNTQSIKKKAFCTVLHIIVLLSHCITSQCRGGTPPDVRLSLPNKETTKGTDWDYGDDRDDDDDDDDIDDSEMMTAAKMTVILNQARKEITKNATSWTIATYKCLELQCNNFHVWDKWWCKQCK